MYHAFGGVRSGEMRRYACSEKEIARQASALASLGYSAVNISTACGDMAGREPRQRSMIGMTMDDGYMDNYEIAAPVLNRFGFTATVFIVGSYVGKTNEWMERNGFQSRRLMGWEEIRSLAMMGFEIGSHTLSHPDLRHISDRDLAREVGDSKKMIEDKIGRAVDSFSYPHGLMDARVKDAVARAGYRFACTTNSGFNRPGKDRLVLRRMEVYGTDSLARFKRKLAFGVNDAPLSLSLGYYARRLGERAAVLARTS